MTKQQVIFGVGSALLITGVVYFGFIKKYENGLSWYGGLVADKEGDAIGGGGNETKDENFKKLAANIPVAVPASGVIKFSFNNGKNTAAFYNNNRVILARVNADKTVTTIVKGVYSDGGKTILRDSDGAQITTSSIYTTLQNAVK